MARACSHPMMASTRPKGPGKRMPSRPAGITWATTRIHPNVSKKVDESLPKIGSCILVADLWLHCPIRRKVLLRLAKGPGCNTNNSRGRSPTQRKSQLFGRGRLDEFQKGFRRPLLQTKNLGPHDGSPVLFKSPVERTAGARISTH